MSFFKKTREEQTPSPAHQATKAVKRLLRDEAIPEDETLVKYLCSGMMEMLAYTCTGGCYDIIWMISEPSSLFCPQCGRPIKPLDSELPEDFFKDESRVELAGMAHYQYAMMQINRNEPEGAIKSLTRAIACKPDYVDAYFNRSELRIGAGDLQGAIEDCNKTIELSPKDADAFMNRGSAKLQLDDFAGGLSDTDIAITLGFANPVALFNRAYCLLRLNRPAEAFDSLEKFVAAAPTHPCAEQAKAWLAMFR